MWLPRDSVLSTLVPFPVSLSACSLGFKFPLHLLCSLPALPVLQVEGGKVNSISFPGSSPHLGGSGPQVQAFVSVSQVDQVSASANILLR